MKLKKYEIIATFDDDLECGYDLDNLYVVQNDFDITEISKEFRELHSMNSSAWSLFNRFYEYLIKKGFIKKISSYVSCKPWQQQRKGGLRLQIQRCNEVDNVSLWNGVNKLDAEGFII